MDTSKLIRTSDRKFVQPGDRAFNYYDGKWGTIANYVDSEGWFDFHQEDGTTAYLNGERICTYEPKR